MSSEGRDQDQALALAALYQALGQVRRVAGEGRSDEGLVAVCLRGLIEEYRDQGIAAVYGGGTSLRDGLERLHTQLANPRDMELTRYAVIILHLERKLVKHRPMLARLGEGLAQARQQADYFSPTHENVIGRLADLYADTVSQLTPRVMVHGKREWLEDPRHANLIRAMLLSAVRAATFWRQAGGGRLRLVFGRGRLQKTAHRLLEQASEVTRAD